MAAAVQQPTDGKVLAAGCLTLSPNSTEAAIGCLAETQCPPGVSLTQTKFKRLTDGACACRTFIKGEYTRNPCVFHHLDLDALLTAVDGGNPGWRVGRARPWNDRTRSCNQPGNGAQPAEIFDCSNHRNYPLGPESLIGTGSTALARTPNPLLRWGACENHHLICSGHSLDRGGLFHHRQSRGQGRDDNPSRHPHLNLSRGGSRLNDSQRRWPAADQRPPQVGRRSTREYHPVRPERRLRIV